MHCCLVVFFWAKELGLQVPLWPGTIHIYDVPGKVTQVDIVNLLGEWFGQNAGHASFIGGDFNFVAEDEVRLNLDTGTTTTEATAHAKAWAQHFSHRCECRSQWNPRQLSRHLRARLDWRSGKRRFQRPCYLCQIGVE